MHKLLNAFKKPWYNFGVVTKIILSQSLITIVCLGALMQLMGEQALRQSVTNTAENGYQYARYAIGEVEAQLRQTRSVANYLAANINVTRFLTEVMPEEQWEASHEAMTYVVRYMEQSRSTIYSISLYAGASASAQAAALLPPWDERTYAESHDPASPQSSASNRWYFSTSAEGELSPVLIRELKDGGQTVGVLEIVPATRLATNLVDSVTNILRSKCLLLSNNGEPLYSSPSLTAEEAAICRAQAQSGEGYYAQQSGYVVYVLYCDELQMRVVAYQKANQTFSFDAGQTLRLTALIVLFVGACVLSTSLLYRSIALRIKRLAAGMSEVNDLTQPQLIPVEGRDEIARLTENYNQLLLRLGELTRTAQTAEMLQKTAAYEALQAQIQPHFLYNTLETLRMIAEENDDEQVADMIFLFGTLLRNSMSARDHTTVGAELDNLNNFLVLTKLRMPSLNYEIAAEPEARDVVCPHFIIQPLVENALHHGIRKSLRPGDLRVTAQIKHGFVLIDVEDNGVGISPTRLEEINDAIHSNQILTRVDGASNGLGIHNVYARVQIFFGKESDVTLESTEGVGTTCHMKMGPF